MAQSDSVAESAGSSAPASFAGKLAVVTGGGSGMGRELARQLAAQGCPVAACDWHADAVAETADLARAGAAPGGPGHQLCLRRLRRGAGAAVPR